jgi:hypothetical protein
MPGRVARGAIAGAVGALALDAASYVDMLVRGRPPSDLPAEVAGRLARQSGLDLGPDQQAVHRRSALGALLGYATGVAVGAAYGLVLGRRRGGPLPRRAVAVGTVMMAAGTIPLTRMGLTDPREWGTAGWLAEVVPHAAYGIATALTFEALRPVTRSP